MYFYVSTNIPKGPHFLAWDLGSSLMFVILFSSSQNAPIVLPSSNFFSLVSLLGCPHSVESLAIALGMWLKLSQSQIKVFIFLTVTHRTNHLRFKCLVLTDPISLHTQDFMHISTISSQHICFSYGYGCHLWLCKLCNARGCPAKCEWRLKSSLSTAHQAVTPGVAFPDSHIG